MKQTDDSRSWHQLPMEKEPLVEAMFQSSIYVELGDGCKALFWTDRWLQGQSLLELAPSLCNVVSARIKGQRTVAQALLGDQWIRDISGALTVQVLLDYLQIWDRTRSIQLTENQPDMICWKLTSDKIFSTSSAYLAFFIEQHPIEGAKLLRKARAPAKCKFFIWLVLHDRCWTAARRKKLGLQDDESCVLCAQLPETIDHLLTTCPFSREVWFKVLCKVGWERVMPNTHTYSLASWWSEAGKQLPKVDRRGFDSLVILVSWLPWKERNDRTFDRRVRMVDEVVLSVCVEVVAWSLAGYRQLELALVTTGVFSGRAFVTE